MCSLCGVLGRGPAWEDEGQAANAEARWRLRRQAMATATEVTRLLAAARIRIDASPDFGFLILFPTGGTEMVKSLGEIWHVLARRGIAIPDPLAVEDRSVP